MEDVVEKLKEETKKNVEELKEILPSEDDLPIDYEVCSETVEPQQYYELAKLTLEILRLIWLE